MDFLERMGALLLFISIFTDDVVVTKITGGNNEEQCGLLHLISEGSSDFLYCSMKGAL